MAQILGEPKKAATYHSKRRQVLSSADAILSQVQVIDNDGKEHVSFVYACGPTDVFISETMDGMFDQSRRRRAPKWMIEQLQSLPIAQQFDFRGQPKTSNKAKAATPAEADESMVTPDEDFVSA